MSRLYGEECHPQGAEVTGQSRVNGKLRHLRCCTLEDQSLSLKRKHRVHKYINMVATGHVYHDLTHIHVSTRIIIL